MFVVGFRRHHAFLGLIQHFGIAQKQRCSTFRRFKNGPKEMVHFRSFFEPLSHFKVAKPLFGCFFRTFKVSLLHCINQLLIGHGREIVPNCLKQHLEVGDIQFEAWCFHFKMPKMSEKNHLEQKPSPF